METNKLIKKLPTISATVLIFCFFLPWFKLGVGLSTDNHSMNLYTVPFNITYSGYDFLGATSELRQINDLPDMIRDIMLQTGAGSWEIEQMEREMAMAPSVPGYSILLYLLVLIPLFGIAILILNSMGKRSLTKLVSISAGAFGVILFLVMLVAHVSTSSISVRDYMMLIGEFPRPGEFPNSMMLHFGTMSIGFYLMFLASAGCIVSFFTSFKSDQ